MKKQGPGRPKGEKPNMPLISGRVPVPTKRLFEIKTDLRNMKPADAIREAMDLWLLLDDATLAQLKAMGKEMKASLSTILENLSIDNLARRAAHRETFRDNQILHMFQKEGDEKGTASVF